MAQVSGEKFQNFIDLNTQNKKIQSVTLQRLKIEKDKNENDRKQIE